MKFICTYWKDGEWRQIPARRGKETVCYMSDDRFASVILRKTDYGWDYTMEAAAEEDTQIRLSVSLESEMRAFHVIPCTIYGDNNIDRVKPGEFPSLTEQYPGTRFCSPFWELRADRAATPISMMCGIEAAVGVSIDPYSLEKGTWIHNGIFAMLPDMVGVSMGYTNLPCTFIDKGNAGEKTAEYVRSAKTEGSVYLIQGGERRNLHQMIRMEYEKRHSRATYEKSFEEAAAAMIDTCITLNWNKCWKSYTDMSCCPPLKKELHAWRPVYEIGWTGIAELACPLLMAESLLGISRTNFGAAADGRMLFDQITGSWNEKSGLLNDLIAPVDESGSLTGGWWKWYYIKYDCHYAYTNGKAVYGLLKACSFLKNRGEKVPVSWLSVSLNVLDTVVSLQREDGNYGYTYSSTERKVLDWDGFAGCWFLPCMVYAWILTDDTRYLESAKRAQNYYGAFVRDLNCYSTPMDTWKAVDEEGNLAFIRGMRLLHEATGDEQCLKDLEAGADFEYLWRYGYAARPEYDPIKEGWNSCGGSVTSISNPHIHPMGVLINTDLRYLAKVTRDNYHKMRADDGTAWMMQCLELYPEKSGYGRYGIISERFCPSDGLVTERDSNGNPYSSWFTYNLWAVANVLEATMDILWEQEE